MEKTALIPWEHDEEIHAYWVVPGRLLAGEYPNRASEEGDGFSKLSPLIDAGVRTFIDLTDEYDLLDPYEDMLCAYDKGINYYNFPIPDLGIVGHDKYDEILYTIDNRISDGVVYVHCWGGIGRTGTVVGCYLVSQGMSPMQALQRIEKLRNGSRKQLFSSPQTPEQVQIVLERS